MCSYCLKSQLINEIQWEQITNKTNEQIFKVIGPSRKIKVVKMFTS